MRGCMYREGFQNHLHNNVLEVTYLCETPSYKCSSDQGLSQDFKNACQKSNSKISVCPDLDTILLQFLILTASNSLLCQKGQLRFQLCLS